MCARYLFCPLSSLLCCTLAVLTSNPSLSSFCLLFIQLKSSLLLILSQESPNYIEALRDSYLVSRFLYRRLLGTLTTSYLLPLPALLLLPFSPSPSSPSPPSFLSLPMLIQFSGLIFLFASLSIQLDELFGQDGIFLFSKRYSNIKREREKRIRTRTAE